MKNVTKQEVVAVSRRGAKKDQGVKLLWDNKEIVAPLLYMVVPEFAGMTTREVLQYFDGDILTEEIPLNDLEDFDLYIQNEGAEISAIHEKPIVFDKYFSVLNPQAMKQGKKEEHLSVYLHIDLEMQKYYHPSNPAYPITKRAVYYGARALGKQLGTVTGKSNYADLEKVYSIWICDNVSPKTLQNTVSSYRIKREDNVGECSEPEGYHDLISVIVIRLGDSLDRNKVFDYIDSVFQADIERMKQYSDVEWPEELETEASRMITMEDYIVARNQEKWLEEGREEGREKGREEGREDMSTIILNLISSGRIEEVKRACEDKEFREKLYKEMGLHPEMQ